MIGNKQPTNALWVNYYPYYFLFSLTLPTKGHIATYCCLHVQVNFVFWEVECVFNVVYLLGSLAFISTILIFELPCLYLEH